MGFSKKHQVDESESKKWVIAGITVRGPLRSISTKPKDEYKEEDDEAFPRSPTAKESRIPEKLQCPPAPRKRRPKSICHYNSGRDFFIPPDLESVFIRHVERAN